MSFYNLLRKIKKKICVTLQHINEKSVIQYIKTGRRTKWSRKIPVCETAMMP